MSRYRQTQPWSRFWLVFLLTVLSLTACTGTPASTVIPPTATTALTSPTVPANTATIAPTRPVAPTQPATPTALRTPEASAAMPALTAVGLSEENLSTIAVGGPDFKTLYVGGKGVWRSTNAGKDWSQVRTAAEAPAVAVIAIAPSDPSVVYIGVSQGCGKGGNLPGYVTTNGGETWAAMGENISSLVVDSHNARVVTAVNCANVRRSSDGGTTWQPLPSATLPNYTPTLIAAAPSAPKIFYLAYTAEGGSVKTGYSNDDGESWQFAEPHTEIIGALDLVVLPNNNQSALLSTTSGIYQTSDSGATWRLLQGSGWEATVPAAPPAGSPPNYRINSTILLDPTHPGTWWVGTGNRQFAGVGIIQSRDSGATWTQTATALQGRAVQDFALVTTSTTSLLYIATSKGVWLLTSSY